MGTLFFLKAGFPCRPTTWAPAFAGATIFRGMGARHGQHFLANPEAIRRIADSLDLSDSDAVLEIGPGRGALTGALLERAGGVVAVEVDAGLVPGLQARFGANPRFSLVESDILEFDPGRLPRRPRPYKIAGNLPYQLTSPILAWMARWTGWSCASVMVQKEVGDRLCASPGTGAYGALTVGVALTCALRPVMDLSPGSFRPPPKVRSSVIRLDRRPSPLVADGDFARRVVQAAFQQRRKTVLNAFAHGLGLSKDRTAEILAEARVSPNVRAESVDVDGYVRLTEAFKRALAPKDDFS